MILADTSVWVEFLRVNKNIYPIFKELIEQGEILAMECVFGELLQGAKTTRERNIILEYRKYLPKENEQGVWIDAGEFSIKNSLIEKGIGLIDCAIICFARKNKAKIWSFDKKLLRVLADDEIFKIRE